MDPLLETSAMVSLAAAGFWLGRASSRLPGRWWASGYLLAAAFVAMYALARANSALEFLPPFSWLLAGRRELALGGFLTTLILSTPLSRLRGPRERRAVLAFMALIVFFGTVRPFFAPALNHRALSTMETRMDANGICLQNTDYTCGPAAAVTHLRRLGIPATEGELAILAHTSKALGTPPDVMAAALGKRYAGEGLHAEYRRFRSIDDLQGAGAVLAVVRYGLLVDHYVAILEVNDREVVIGDPLVGKQTCTREEFAKRWRFTGVVLRRAGLSEAGAPQ